MIGYPAPLLAGGVRRSNHDRGCDRRDGWVGLSSWPQRLEASPGWKAQTTSRAKWRSSTSPCSHVRTYCLTVADIVRDGDFATTTSGRLVPWLSLRANRQAQPRARKNQRLCQGYLPSCPNSARASSISFRRRAIARLRPISFRSLFLSRLLATFMSYLKANIASQEV